MWFDIEKSQERYEVLLNSYNKIITDKDEHIKTLFDDVQKVKRERSEIEDEYFNNLKKEYQFLKAKFELKSLDKSIWKMLRLRPSNFPTIRISQLANLLSHQSRLFSKVISADSVVEIQKILHSKSSDYWKTHYQFGHSVEKSTDKNIGLATINSVIINVIVPFIFAK